jgi:hypothetical protein
MHRHLERSAIFLSELKYAAFGVPPMSNGLASDAQTSQGTHGPEATVVDEHRKSAHATKWSGPIPDEDSPERQAYLDSLGDDDLPELSEADRQRKADWDRRRAATEAREAEHFRKQKRKKDCA